MLRILSNKDEIIEEAWGNKISGRMYRESQSECAHRSQISSRRNGNALTRERKVRVIYAQAQLTYGTDRKVALSGLLKASGTSSDFELVAGIYKTVHSTKALGMLSK